MKKIIATVLAMVMALALCTTAFAAGQKTGYTGYDAGNNEKANEYAFEAVDADSTNVAYYKVWNYVTGAASWGDAAYYVKATKADFDLKLTKDGAATLYLSECENPYYIVKAVEFTKIGEGCGQLDADEDGKYYTNAKKVVIDDVTYEAGEAFFRQLKEGGADIDNVLVDGKLVPVVMLADAELNGHNWVAVLKDGKVDSYKCADCGQTAAIYKTKDAAKASGLKNVEAYVNDDGDVIYLAWTAGKTAENTNTNPSSPKTFDAGIAMYVGMALTSVAGSAVVIGKKKEF